MVKKVKLSEILEDINYKDGSLRDIYIKNTDIKSWDKVLEIVYSTYETLNSIQSKDLLKIKDILRVQESRSITLNIYLSKNVIVNCHFFLSEEYCDQIEFDYDPKEIRSTEEFRKILEFISNIGRVLKQEVVITPENSPDDIIVCYCPNTDEILFINLEKEKMIIEF